MPTKWTSRAIAALGLVTALVVAGCGQGASGEDDAPPAPGFPVAVDHAYGTTMVPAPPQRVVALGYTDADPLLAVGIAPVGIVDWFAVPPAGAKWPWQEAGFAGVTPEVVGVREEVDVEKIASLAPDLIVAAYSGMTRERYDQLSGIAPVVAQPRGYEQFAAPWPVMTEHLARAVGREDRARTAIDTVQRRIAEVRAAHPQWAQRTAAVAAYQAGTYPVFSPRDAKTGLLVDLGFRFPPELDALAGSASETTLSAERLDLLDVDVLLMSASNPTAQAEIAARPEFANLPAVREGRLMWLLSSDRDPPVTAAFGYNSVLSLPFVLDTLVPRLDALPAPTP